MKFDAQQQVTPGTSRGDQNAAFKIVIAYENVAAALRARHISEWLVEQLESEVDIDSNDWGFDSLDHPHLCDQATTEAAAADMIIISARGDVELPGHVKDWITRWAPRKRGGATALVALLHQRPETSDDAAPLCAYLRQAAEQGSMDFFCKAGGWQEQDAEYAVEIIQRRPESNAAGPRLEALHETAACRDWGINE